MKHYAVTARLVLLAGALLLLPAMQAAAAAYPPPVEADFTMKDFRFASGESLAALRIHYRTLGTPRRDAQRSRAQCGADHARHHRQRRKPDQRRFAGELFAPGQPLDATRYFLILPDGIGHGHSSKPSDGLHARFPHYGYRDMVEADYRLLTDGLKVNHARLIMGTSMGGMHTWLWGELHPQFMDALMPLASLPTQISGRNRAWRRLIIDAIRNDPAWAGGEYASAPPSVRTALEMLWLMGSNPVLRQQEAPTLAQADQVIDRAVAAQLPTADANDILYAVSASQDYDPGPALERIEAPLLAVNSADDLINPPELRILEREIVRVPHGRALVIPFSERTHGHGSHTYATLWRDELVKLLDAAPER